MNKKIIFLESLNFEVCTSNIPAAISYKSIKVESGHILSRKPKKKRLKGHFDV